MSLSALNSRVTDPVGQEILQNTNHIVNEALNAIKEISNNMSPHVLTNTGVASAISAFAAKVNMMRGVVIDFRTNMEGSGLTLIRRWLFTVRHASLSTTA